MNWTRVGLWAQAVLYATGGVNHFLHEAFYVGIMPEHYSHPGALVLASGVAEVAGGVGLLVPATRRVAAAGLGVMLLGFLDVHVWMVRHPARFPGVPVWVLWARIPLQFVLIAWAWRYARRPRAGGRVEDVA